MPSSLASSICECQIAQKTGMIDCLRAIGRVERLARLHHMIAYASVAAAQDLTDFPIRLAPGSPVKALDLPFRQTRIDRQ